MRVDKSQLLRLCPSYPSDRLNDDLRVLNEWSDRFGIKNNLRMQHFIAQLACESMGFTAITENLNYSAKRLMEVFPKKFTPAKAQQYAGKPQAIANYVYANRMGNGNEASGDGWKYRGRGYVQLTGKSNYQAYQNSGLCVGNLMAHPEWLCNTPGRLKSAMWYFMSHGCNELADKDDIRSITIKINGGLNGYSDRAYYLRKAKKIFI